jgi:hypothetical protein
LDVYQWNSQSPPEQGYEAKTNLGLIGIEKAKGIKEVKKFI